MSLKINVGFTQKLGQPDYGSIGASCNVECDLDSKMLFDDPFGFQKQVQEIYQACTQAVNDELTRFQNGTHNNGTNNGNGAHSSNGNGHGNGPGHGNGHSNGTGAGNGTRNRSTSQNGSRRAASQAQVRALLAIAQRQEFDLTNLLKTRFGVDLPADLTLQQASNLIDELNAFANAPANGAGGRR